MSKIGKTSSVPSVLPKSIAGAAVAIESGAGDGVAVGVEAGVALASAFQRHKHSRNVTRILRRINTILILSGLFI